MAVDTWMKQIPGSESWQEITEIVYGWSGERKYRIRSAAGEELLLRVAQGEAYPKMCAVHRAMQSVNDLHIRASRAIACGRTEQHAWALLTYIAGSDAEKGLPGLPQSEQYRLGFETGCMLRRIHSIPAPEDRPSWEEHFNAKIDRKRSRWQESGCRMEGSELAFAYIDSHRHLLCGRPQSLQHGDYHCGNMVLTPDGGIGVIDFNRLDWGDPWEEFNRIIWDVRVSPAFASGRVDGYFAPQEPPELFWQLLALYVTNDQISALPWALAFNEREAAIATQNFKAVLSWYDGFCTVRPSWYQRGSLPER